MAAVTICSDFGAPQKIKSVTVSIVSPSICHEVMGLDAMTLMLSFKPAFSLSSFTFIKRLLSSSSVYRKMQESGLTEIIPMYLSYQLSGFWVFTSWISSGLTLVSGCSLMATREKLFFLSWVPSRLTSSLPGWLQTLMTLTSFACWYGRKHSTHNPNINNPHSSMKFIQNTTTFITPVASTQI